MLGGHFDPTALKSQVAELEKESGDPTFWNNRTKAEQTLGRISTLKGRYEPWNLLFNNLDELLELYAMALEAEDESFEVEITELIKKNEQEFSRLSTLEMLREETDPLQCFLTVHAGAGGTESCDWTRMLYRMYSRWCNKKGFSIEIVDEQEDEGGYKSVSLQIMGAYAYGFLKGETGVHRLVRISPFDSASRRHTTFASVYVSPVLDDTITVDIKSDDLRVDTYRASGAGGQKVNKTSSAVRLTHLATNIVVQCQNERSQHRNKEIAMEMLKGRLYSFYKNQRDTERAQTAAEKSEIGFGHQIRSYVFHPYSMVKDVRTKIETGNVASVMDGEIDQFIDGYLRSAWAKSIK